MKVGRLGPRIVAIMPLITKPANSAAWTILRWRASGVVEAGNMCAVILREVRAAGNETVVLRGESVSLWFLEQQNFGYGRLKRRFCEWRFPSAGLHDMN